MKTLSAVLCSASPYSQSKAHITPRQDNETHDEYDKRTWREKLHVDDAGKVFIPAMSIRYALSSASKYLKEKIGGRGNATYTKHFDGGILIENNCSLEITPQEVEFEDIYVNADGKRGSGTRVWRRFPLIRGWQATVVILVPDPILTKDVLTRHLEAAGRFVGIGRWRPEKLGMYGRFSVEAVDWE